MINDLYASLKLWRIWLFLSYEEIRTNYRRTLLGPWWSVINVLFLAVPICLLYKNIFHSNNDNYYLYVLTGLIIWNFISSSINSGVLSLMASGGYLKEIKLPFCLFLLKALAKNSIVFFHTLILFFIYLIFFGKDISFAFLLVFPYLLLLLIALFFWCFLGAIVVLYFRDLIQLLPRILNFFFLITPIVWESKVVSHKYQFIIQLNPMSTLLNIVREPLLGVAPSLHQFIIVLIIIFSGFLSSMLAFKLSKNKIIFLV